MPQFSIVVPAYNAQGTIAETLDAVVRQEWRDWECIVVDDGSQDQTLAIVSRYAEDDPRVGVVSQPNRGSAGAYNTGVGQARGDYVVMCSADDVLLPQHLVSMARAIDADDSFDVYSSNGYYLYPDGSRKVVYAAGEIPSSMTLAEVIRNCFYSVGAAYRLVWFDRIGGYRLGVYGEDYDFWLRAMAAGARHRYVPAPLSLHRVSLNQKSADLETVYRSDIRLVTDLRRSARLSPDELAAVEECVRVRRRYLSRIQEPPMVRSFRDLLTPSATAVLGRGRINRLSRRVRLGLRRISAVAAHSSRASARRDDRNRPLKVLVIPSWFPSTEHPTAGVFISQQVRGIAKQVDVAVISVREAFGRGAVRVVDEGGLPVVRAELRMPPASRTLPGRARAVATNVVNKLYRYPRCGLAAFEALRRGWGTPDIVHVQALWPAGLIACTIKRRYGIPYVVTEHSEEYLAASERRLVRTPGVVRLLLRPLAHGASRTIAVSQFLAERLTELGLAVNPVVIPNAVPVTDALPLPVAGRHVITHVSIMGPAKNLEGLLRAVDVLRRRRTDFVLRLVGDGESRSGLERLAVELGLGGTVEFTGRVDAGEVRRLLGESVFTVVSSTHETFSVVAVESLTCGRPVLCTRCGGPEEFITPEVGRLIAAGGADALVDGLDWMLDHFHEFDPQALHEYAAARFAPGVVARQILEVYREVLGA